MDSKELLQMQLSTKKKKKTGVKPDLSNGIDYNVKMRKMVQAISKDVVANIMPLVKQFAPEYARDAAIETNDSWVDILSSAISFLKNKWSSPQFKLFADDVAGKFVTTANQSNRKRTERDLGVNIYSDNQELSDYLRASAIDNANLIKSIPEQYLTQVESIVMTNVRAGGRPSAIAKALQEQLGVTERRAKMIARDQTAKINGDLNRMRQINAGFPYFLWVDSDDQRVRRRHERIASTVTAYGKGIYRWDNPPLSDKGVPIIPGQDYSCRCIAISVSQDEVDANVKAGLTNPSVKR